MCIAAFNPSELPTAKLYTATTMISVLDETFKGSLVKLKVTYNDKSHLFTIENTVEMDQTSIATVVAEATYQIWKPEVLEGRSLEGNLLVILQAITPSYKDSHLTVTPPSGFRGALFSEADSYSTDSTPSPRTVPPKAVKQEKGLDDLPIARQEKPVLCLDDPGDILPIGIGRILTNPFPETGDYPPTDSEILLRIMRIYWEAKLRREI